MSEIRLWMRRAVDEGYYRYINGTSEKECYLKAIAAHAPPVEEMVAVLSKSLPYSRGKALDIYNAWLAHEADKCWEPAPGCKIVHPYGEDGWRPGADGKHEHLK